MRKAIATLILSTSTAVFSAQTMTKEELLVKVQEEVHKSILYKEKIAQKEELEAGIQIGMNLSKFCKLYVPKFIDKYILLQEEAFAYGKAHPEALEDETLVLPETPVSKEFLQKVFVVGAKLLFSEESDYEKLRNLGMKLDAEIAVAKDVWKKELLAADQRSEEEHEKKLKSGNYDWEDLDYDNSWYDYRPAFNGAKKVLEKKCYEDALEIVKNAQDPLLSEFLYPLYLEVHEDPIEWVTTHFVRYSEKRIGNLFLEKEKPQNALEEKIVAARDELRRCMLDFSKSQKMAMSVYLEKCLSK